MKRSQSLGKSLDDVKYEQYVNNLHDRLPQLNDPSDVDCQRWPWELLQNAKDTVVKRKNPEERYVDVTIKHYIDSDGKKKLYFEHNGDQFTNKAITGLIWKFSAEKRSEQTTEDGLTRDKQSTGRFGTGFMTTHSLSLTVDVSGSLFHDDPDVMRNVSVDFTLHREGPDDEAYKKGVNDTEQEIDDNMDKRPIPDGKILPTRFTYYLNREASSKAAKMGLENIRCNAAQTMLFCPSVRSITMIDEVNSTNFKITRNNNNEQKDIIKETTFVEEYDNNVEPITRRFISLEIEEYSEAISNHWKTKNRNLRLHIAIEVDKDNNILPIPTNSPAVYCSLPLIGFENMSLPFYINSNDFEPTTERTSLYLKKKRFEYRSNEDTGEDEIFYLQSGINWSIFERSLPLYERLVDFLVDNNYEQRYNLVSGLGNILKGTWEEETKNCLASRFILPLRTMLTRKKLVKTIEHYKSIDAGVKFVECAKDCDASAFYNICSSIYGSNIAIEEENQHWVSYKWGRYDFKEDFDEKKPESENPVFPIIKYGKIADYIENAGNIDNLNLIIDKEKITAELPSEITTCQRAYKLNWLNKFYQWIESSKITNLADRKIVPNRLGEFCSTESGCNLKDASDISTDIFDFMKKISINWDNKLLMEGVQHISLTKETKDNVVTAIKNRTKEIRESADKEIVKLTKLLPLLLATPSNKDGRTNDFYHKRIQIVSILTKMYNSLLGDCSSVDLDLKAETWEESDLWFMSLVAKDIAKRKKLDIICEGDTKETIANKYCTAKWLSQTLDFMFERGYLHQEDITAKENQEDTLAIIPNRYGDFCYVNELHTQGIVPDELTEDELNKTNYDIKKELLYKDFSLNKKITITELSITSIATIYNEFFECAENEDTDDKKANKLSVAKFLIHLTPDVEDLYVETRTLYNEFVKTKSEDITTKKISISDLNLWKGAKQYLLLFLADKVSSLGSIKLIGEAIDTTAEQNDLIKISEEDYNKIGIDWLNRLVNQINTNKIDIPDYIKLIPDWYGTLHYKSEMLYDSSQLIDKYTNAAKLVDVINGSLQKYFCKKVDGDEKLVFSLVHPNFTNVSSYQHNTDEKVFDLVDRMIWYCSQNYSSDWISILKDAIRDLLSFFDENEKHTLWYNPHNKNNEQLRKLFKETYPKRKELSYDFIFDTETKARFSQMNDNYSLDEMEILIDNKDFVKKILQNKNLTTIQAIIEEFPNTDYQFILNCLRNAQGDYDTKRFEQNISDKRKTEIGDKGECFVYEMLCRQFGDINIKWSNLAPNDNNARIVTYNNKEYQLITTPHDFDFIVSHNDRKIYIEVKTTIGNIKNSKDFPLIFETKEWEWIDKTQEKNTMHYIVRVFDIEGTPKAYFLKQEINVEALYYN